MKVILVDAVFCFVIEKGGTFEVYKDMHDLLESYPNRKIVLTGADDDGFKKYGLDKVPYEVFTLKHNPEKVDPEYYNKMLQKYDLGVDQVVYFEHNPDAVKSAQSIGMNTYYYDNEKKDLDSLRRFLNENL